VAAFGGAAIMQKLRERPLGPTLRRRVDFAGVRAHADGNGDALGVKEARLRRLPDLLKVDEAWRSGLSDVPIVCCSQRGP